MRMASGVMVERLERVVWRFGREELAGGGSSVMVEVWERDIEIVSSFVAEVGLILPLGLISFSFSLVSAAGVAEAKDDAEDDDDDEFGSWCCSTSLLDDGNVIVKYYVLY